MQREAVREVRRRGIGGGMIVALRFIKRDGKFILQQSRSGGSFQGTGQLISSMPWEDVPQELGLPIPDNPDCDRDQIIANLRRDIMEETKKRLAAEKERDEWKEQSDKCWNLAKAHLARIIKAKQALE
jgi:hypothetical protein